MTHRFVVALMPGLVCSTGCYSAVGDWTITNAQRPTGTQSIAYGSGLGVQRDADSNGALVGHVEEVALCRSYETGTAYTERSRMETENMWPFVVGTVVGLMGLGATIGGAAVNSANAGQFDCVPGQGCAPTRTVGPTLVTGGVLGMVGAAALIVPWIIRPTARTEKEEHKIGPYKKWREGAVACSPAQAYAKPTQVALELKSDAGGASIATWMLPTDAAGKFQGGAIATAQRIASYCGSSTLFVSDASPARENNDTPDAPQPVRERHGVPISVPIAPTGTRETLAAMAIDDPTAASLALRCCKEDVKRDTEPKCAARCLEAAGATKCLNGMRACEVQAKTGEFVDDGLSRCGQLLLVCLAAHGSGASQLSACKSMCATKNAAEVCK